ncbi:hypothetical protein GQ457_08G020760 [Hibiscus cannabinus]
MWLIGGKRKRGRRARTVQWPDPALCLCVSLPLDIIFGCHRLRVVGGEAMKHLESGAPPTTKWYLHEQFQSISGRNK